PLPVVVVGRSCVGFHGSGGGEDVGRGLCWRRDGRGGVLIGLRGERVRLAFEVHEAGSKANILARPAAGPGVGGLTGTAPGSAGPRRGRTRPLRVVRRRSRAGRVAGAVAPGTRGR